MTKCACHTERNEIAFPTRILMQKRGRNGSWRSHVGVGCFEDKKTKAKRQPISFNKFDAWSSFCSIFGLLIKVGWSTIHTRQCLNVFNLPLISSKIRTNSTLTHTHTHTHTCKHTDRQKKKKNFA